MVKDHMRLRQLQQAHKLLVKQALECKEDSDANLEAAITILGDEIERVKDARRAARDE